MFKNMKLGTKILMGFGIVIIIAAVIGYTGYSGVRSVEGKVLLADQGNECRFRVDDCAAFRRDFAIQGFEKAAGSDKNAAEKWQEACQALLTDLNSLSADSSGATKEVKALALAAATSTLEYKSIFEEQVEARKTKDEAVVQWGEIGGQITQQIGVAMDDVIKPAIVQAQSMSDINQYARWHGTAEGLNEEVIERFLMLRIVAVYLIAQNTDARYETYAERLAELKEGVQTWGETIKGDAKLEKAAKEIQGFLGEYETAGKSFYDSILKERDTTTRMGTAAGQVVKAMADLQATLKDEMNTITQRTVTLALTLTVAGIVLGLALGLTITRAITKPINNVITGLRDGADQVTAASGQVSQSSQVMAEGASEQASSLEETSASLEEMASMTRQNADNANQANGMAKQATEACQRGRDAMGRMGDAIGKIKESSDETAKIIKTIDEIAFQTNLLALNAAVEAARAGEAGKGFAVVAEEVRNLAQRSAEAAKNTSELIEGAQQNAENGVSASTEVGDILAQIAESVDKVTQLVAEVTAASNEQAQGIEQINTAVAQMDQVTQANAASSEEAASASEELSAQAAQLNEMVNVLVQIVGGASGGGASRPQPAQPRRQAVAGPKFAQAKAPALGGSRRTDTAVVSRAQQTSKDDAVISPESVIPLDDEDLKDF